ncbi:S1 RNA-binding domain-containing protein [Candidatus Uhrbacteria bacterium]|nr:S1 RNA-binding domain-containing protein [Candidatus Uhrbacteria bacterium]
MMTQQVEDQSKKEFRDLLDQYSAKLPKVGDIISGRVISVSKGEVQIDIDGIATGLVRGYELIDESGEYSDLHIGDEVHATVLEMENERGLVELSFRSAGHQKAWDKLRVLMQSGEIVSVKTIDANKGGLMVSCGNVNGFMPVSQLCPEHYPRIQGGDKNKILDKLKSYIGESFDAKVIDVNEDEEKLIVSEKAAWEVKQKDVISSYTVGDTVEGVVTVITDFGAFVEFGEGLEGLIHISEIAWQRIDDPKEFLRSGQKVKAQIIKIEGSKIFLSMKNLIPDPWKNVKTKYAVGQKVTGKVLKVNPFGLFVELDPEIHGLAHVSELSAKGPVEPSHVATAGVEMEFMVVSIEPEEHRLGLSLKALTQKPASSADAQEQPLSSEAQAPQEVPESSEEHQAEEAPDAQETHEDA